MISERSRFARSCVKRFYGLSWNPLNRSCHSTVFDSVFGTPTKQAVQSYLLSLGSRQYYFKSTFSFSSLIVVAIIFLVCFRSDQIYLQKRMWNRFQNLVWLYMIQYGNAQWITFLFSVNGNGLRGASCEYIRFGERDGNNDSPIVSLKRATNVTNLTSSFMWNAIGGRFWCGIRSGEWDIRFILGKSSFGSQDFLDPRPSARSSS